MRERLRAWFREELSPELADQLRGIQIFEFSLLAVGLGSLIALILRGGLQSWMALELTLACALYVGLISQIRGSQRAIWQRLRLLSSYVFTLWFYGAIERLTPALGTELRDSQLRAFDRIFFAETPAALMTGSWWKTELLSGAYTSYLIYLHWALIGWLLGPLEDARRFWTFLFVTYSFGFLGYLLVPAIGPAKAFPEIFDRPIVGSGQGILSQINNFVAQGSSVYDVFPSLHILITLVLLDFDRRSQAWRFVAALPLCALLFVSTIYLRYHYFVDLLAGAILFMALRAGFERWLDWDGSISGRLSSNSD